MPDVHYRAEKVLGERLKNLNRWLYCLQTRAGHLEVMRV